MKLQIDGIVKHVLPLQSGTSAKTGKQWQSQDFVIETFGAYPSTICFTMFNDKISPLSDGQRVRVSFDPRSREYNGRWYTTLTAYEIETIGNVTVQQPQQEQQQQGSTLPPIPQKQALDDDLPF